MKVWPSIRRTENNEEERKMKMEKQLESECKRKRKSQRKKGRNNQIWGNILLLTCNDCMQNAKGSTSTQKEIFFILSIYTRGS